MSTINAQSVLEKGGEEYELCLEGFFGGITEAFYENTHLFAPSDGDGMIANIIDRQNVTQGTSFTFYMMGEDPEPSHHTGGERISGQDQELDQDSVTLDKTLVSSREPKLDHVEVSPVDFVSRFGRAIGRSLGEQYDSFAFITALNAARTAALSKNGSTIHSGGNVVERVGASGITSAYPATLTGAFQFRDDLSQMGQLADEDNLPQSIGSRLAWTTPYMFRRVLAKDTSIFNSDLSRQLRNDLNRQEVVEVDGWVLMSTNRLPSTEITEASFGGTTPSKYHVDARYNGAVGQPAAITLIASEEARAIGQVIRRGIRLYMNPDERYRTLFMKGEMRIGFDVLNPWMAGEIRVDDA